METHELKLVQPYFDEVKRDLKNFELRKNDRDYKVGDFLRLLEWDGENYTGHECNRCISYVLKDCTKHGLKKGYCILGFEQELFPSI